MTKKMSHLPLDARAILEYLNELGYRNITAEQLKEFMKGMQPQSESSSSKSKQKTKCSSNQHQQQQHSQLSTKQLATAAASTTTTTTTTATNKSTAEELRHRQHHHQEQQYQQSNNRPIVKVIKCKKPLQNFKFYLDVCDHQVTKKIEEQIKALGGELEFFLSLKVTHFITDKTVLVNSLGINNNLLSSRPGTPQTPATVGSVNANTPGTPKTPYSLETCTDTNRNNGGHGATPNSTRRTRQSRADAILNRARRQSTTSHTTNTLTSVALAERLDDQQPTITILNRRSNEAASSTSVSLSNTAALPYIIWQTEYALRFFKKVQHELKDYIGGGGGGSGHTQHQQASHNHHQRKFGGKQYTVEPIHLKGGFIKIEAVKHNYRPYYQLFKKPSGEWPKIELTRDDGAFRLSPKKSPDEVALEHQKKLKQQQQQQQQQPKSMTRKSRSRSSQRPHPPLPAAVQSLKKGEAGGKNSSAGGQAQQQQHKSNLGGDGGVGVDGGGGGGGGGGNGNVGAACQQVKESSDKQCGVCEICKIEYDTLTIHLKTKDHEYFARNSQNFIALDTLIQASADVNKFLDEEEDKQNEYKPDIEDMEVEMFEGLVDDERGAHDEDDDDGGTTEVAGNAAMQPSQRHQNKCNEHATREARRRSSAVSNNNNQKTPPSPSLREKSKRTTKGKHSSEKFQNGAKSATTTTTTTTTITTPAKPSPKTPVKVATVIPTVTSLSSSAQKKAVPSLNATQQLRIDGEAVSGVAEVTSNCVTPKTRKKPSAATSALSPPMRAMLPPSSLYKVVETPELRTPTRKTRDAGDQVAASPSLIVKFKKVRQTELLRLNGEAENFMFPKQRTSSELPTDVDRQTTSENTRVSLSSTSLDSTSEFMEIETENTTATTTTTTATTSIAMANAKTNASMVGCGKKAIAKGKRRKDDAPPVAKQSFPTAPIQPEVQLKRLRTISLISSCSYTTLPATTATTTTTAKTTSITTTTATAISTSTTTTTTTSKTSQATNLGLPEATRKSSRTATAIVTAATKSSRLLRAAVQAAKHSSRRGEPAKASTATSATLEAATNAGQKAKAVNVPPVSPMVTTSIVVRKEQEVAEAFATPVKPTAADRKLKRRCRVSVVKMEDRMGDDEPNTDESDNDEDEDNDDDAQDNDEQDEESDDEMEDDDDDDEDDEDDDDDMLDDDDDEDYVGGGTTGSKRHCYTQSRRRAGTANGSGGTEKRNSLSTRAQRAARRHRQTEITVEDDDDEDDDSDDEAEEEEEEEAPPKKKKEKHKESACKHSKKTHTGKRVNQSKTKAKGNASKSASSASKRAKQPPRPEMAPQTPRGFDIHKSERLRKLRYAFERLPAADLWYRVFRRQDTCDENYFTYFGSTRYRKLPYELGPIPFDRTVSKDAKNGGGGGSCCKLCARIKGESGQQSTPTEAPVEFKQESSSNTAEPPLLKQETAEEANVSSSSTKYTHKNKKLHLLQRYRHEQQQQQQQELLKQQLPARLMLDDQRKPESKASTPDREHERASSTHSNASSCASSSATLNRKLYRSKLLNLELPPRKSPREHASTLALVSCIIKQRQDSQSKPNSDTDEPPSTAATPTPTTPLATTCPKEITAATATATADAITTTTTTATTTTTRRDTPTPLPLSSLTSATPEASAAALRSPRSMRSAAATPVEELRFATEISETVKRMRRGQNKYDYSPPLVLNMGRGRGRGGRGANSHSPVGTARRQTLQASTAQQATPKHEKRHKRKSNLLHATRTLHSYGGAGPAQHNASTTTSGGGCVRKTGSKKGVLEFEMDATALKALDTALRPSPDVRRLEWEIDKYLQHNGREYDVDTCDMPLPPAPALPNGAATYTTSIALPSSGGKNARTAATSTRRRSTATSTTATDVARPPIVIKLEKTCSTTAAATAATRGLEANTPPPTDCFSSDFDLYDLFTNASSGAGLGTDVAIAADSSSTFGGGLNGGKRNGKNYFSLYNSIALQNYFSRRKPLKSNRTGWPKVQKKKVSLRQQQLLQKKIRFLHNSEDGVLPSAAQVCSVKSAGGDDATTNGVRGVKPHGKRRESRGGVITPPDSEADDNGCGHNLLDDNNDMVVEALEENEDDDIEEDAEEVGDVKANVADGNEATNAADVEDDIDEGGGGESMIGDEEEEDIEMVAEFIDDDEDVEPEAELAVESKADDDDEEMGDFDDVEANNEHEEDEEEEEEHENVNDEIEAVTEIDDGDDEEEDEDHDADENEDDDDAEEVHNDEVEETIEADVEDDEEEDVDEVDDDDDDEDQMEDEEEEDEDEEEEEDVEEEEEEYQHLYKRTRFSFDTTSAIEKPNVPSTPHRTSGGGGGGGPLTVTSTPSAQLLRGLRRTPQLNGSLGSCISPSEKAGDNSDIFTVSSDGLDTDLDISNSHIQSRSNDDTATMVGAQTPKRKFDLSKYAPKSTTSCAAEAATAAAKSLAISQFLKKEVRVTCRRLRAPFRRFRYRR